MAHTQKTETSLSDKPIIIGPSARRAQGTVLSCMLNYASVTRIFLVFFRQQPETTFEQCSFDFRIPRRHDVDGNFLLRSLHVLTLRVCSTTLVSFLCLRFNSTATGHFSGKK